MRPDHVAGRLKLCPDLGMNQSRGLGIGNRFQSPDNCLKVPFSLCAMRRCCPFDSMPQFRDGDGGNFQIRGLRIQPCDEVEAAFLAFDDYIGIENYRHLSLGGFTALRAAFRSRCQALASLSDRSTFLKASANSGPVQLFFCSGTSRATGVPFLRSTNVTF